ncbi:MAG TPA: hypothetical protein DIT32_03405 [Peptococcaceae bacterium]|nr:hypothetical protein [Peptococcaceae bacterium]
MSKAFLTIAYSGPVLDDGTMDVKDLAPALLAIGNLIDETNKVLNDNEAKIQVKIMSDFRSGSFDVNIEIIHNLVEQISAFIGNTVDIKEILGVIGLACTLSGESVLELFKRIKGRKIDKVRQIDKDNVEFIFVDRSNSVTTNIQVYNVYNNINIQNAVKEMVKPLGKEGVSGFKTYSGHNDCTQKGMEITKEELEYYNAPSYVENIDAEPINEFVYTGAFKIITAAFEEGLKWRLSNGQDRITATLKDEEFIKKLSSGEINFAKDDILVVEILTKTWQEKDGSLKTENEIVKVKEHRRRSEQMPIMFEPIE